MQILSGKYKKCRLNYPKKGPMRPTQNHVKESLFNILGSRFGDISGTRILDLCCGTGQNGLEALSRGAVYVTFVDIDVRYVVQNVQKLSEIDSTIHTSIQIKKKESVRFILEWAQDVTTRDRYDIIFFDPPWTMDSLYDDTLKCIFEFDILSKQGMLVFEHSKKMDLLAILNTHTKQRMSNQNQYFYGNTGLTVVTCL
jgi:16S rRNA (guanine966-N2)-methyltransferase